MDTMEEVNTSTNDDQFTLNNVIFAGRGHKKCVVCRKDIRGGTMVMPKAARLDLLIIHSMYAPQGVRCCSSHLFNDKHLIPEDKIIMEDRQLLASCLSL
ncbi:unnamed protein product [Rotaria sordida]|uniref:Uncharacterized protein n=1 Tax=Rotaria sordida TaxID=392033 RepID=A0A814XK52_9BILA|nr:unnamed protein product [Rotaria sordida]CAF1216389.1 unnamed protein product [Rotaria sordida]CAF3791024.1 unnamed protein product [Rotaria sordida]CAF4177673.1 unnamed protein product [Rotaria sordida]